ncbi:MAG: S8 family serine peptidase [Pseudomonadota bacterium]
MTGMSVQGFLNDLDAGRVFGAVNLPADAEPIRIAIIDSGIDAAHPALKHKVLKYWDATGEKSEVEENPTENHDTYGHGTAVAGLISRICPLARFYDVRVLGPNNAGTAAALDRGLRWALRSDVLMMNMSLATSFERILPLVEPIENNYFRKKMIVSSRRNIPVRDDGYPAALVATVGVDNAKHLPVSDEGVPLEDLVSYRTAFPIDFSANGTKLKTLAPGGKYTEVTGTSFATPVVCAICACLGLRYPEADPFEIRLMLRAIAERNPEPEKELHKAATA